MRTVQAVKAAQASMDGAGVAIKRVAGFDDISMDPILMIDELRSEHREDFAAGFPPHPHRGMQTLTYMKHGGIVHEDSQGNRGEIRSGGAQYMSAGRGIVHSEMPTQDSAGLHGFQLWFNLPGKDKLAAPRYRDLPLDSLVHREGGGYAITAISGDWQLGHEEAVAGPLAELAPQAAMADLHLDGGAGADIATARGESVLVYIYDGSLRAGGAEQSAQRLLIFGDGEQLRLEAGDNGAGLLLLRGKPIGEPVVHYGPFVMNTAEEIEEAIRDYQAGRFVA